MFQLYSLTSTKKDIHEEVYAAEQFDQHTKNSSQNQLVSSLTPAFLKHSTVVHGNKVHQSDISTKTFTRSTYSPQHKLVQVEVKKYQCDLCAKAFSEAHNLSRHKLIHAGIKKYQCAVCSKSFTPSGLSLIHI